MTDTQAAFTLTDFIRESNRIEGIHRVTYEQIEAHKRFLALEKLTIAGLCVFVDAVAPHAELRSRRGLNVRVGVHVPPLGGPQVETDLRDLLERVQAPGDRPSPFVAHCEYETLHPYTDGNGRSGRVLWLWMMGGIEKAPGGFLYEFARQTLDRGAPFELKRQFYYRTLGTTGRGATRSL